MTQRRAFTLPEIVIAIAILGLVMLTLLSLSATSVRSMEKSSTTAIGHSVAEAQLERVIQDIRADRPAGDKDRFWDGEFPYPDTPFFTSTDPIVVGANKFHYKVFAETVINENTGSPVGGDLLKENRLKKVDVVVWWWSDESGVRQGYGNMKTNVSRMVNETPDV